jgi:thioredoxin 1
MIPTFTEADLGNSGRVLVKFGAPWCGPCKSLEPVLEELHNDGFSIFSVNSDEDQSSTIKYNIRSVPTMIIFENGVQLNTIIGMKTKTEILNELQ